MPEEVAIVEVVTDESVIKFDGSFMASLGGTGVVLYHREGETISRSFRMEFSCSNNIVEYKAYLTGLETTLEMRIQHLRVVCDSNLVVYQAKGSFSPNGTSLGPL